MTREERIRSEIEVWENAAIIYTRALEDSVKYGDYGGQQHNEHMIKYSQQKVESLEAELLQLKSA